MILVVGGANLDLTLRTTAQAVMGTSNPATVVRSAGGVGRNIAENLARLGDQVLLVAAVGNDSAGRELAARTRSAGVDVSRLLRSGHPTGTYVAILDDAGELVIGVSDMMATDALSVAEVADVAWADLTAQARALVLDGNLPSTVMAWLLDMAAAAEVPVVLDPVSVAKAAPIGALLSPARPVALITPNVDELGALVGNLVADEPAQIAEAVAELHRRGVQTVWVRRGGRGSVVSTRAGATTSAGAATSAGGTTNDGGTSSAGAADGSVGAHAISLPAPDALVRDVTGAGDSMTAGFVHAWASGADVATAARFGQAVASLTVESEHTVRPDLSDALVRARLDRGG